MRPIDKINRLKNIYLIIVAVGFAVLFVLAFIEEYMPPAIYKPLLYGAIAVFAAGNILLYVGIRCPKCRSIIGYAIVFSAGKENKCPRCKEAFY